MTRWQKLHCPRGMHPPRSPCVVLAMQDGGRGNEAVAATLSERRSRCQQEREKENWDTDGPESDKDMRKQDDARVFLGGVVALEGQVVAQEAHGRRRLCGRVECKGLTGPRREDARRRGRSDAEEDEEECRQRVE